VAIDYANAAELAEKAGKALKACAGRPRCGVRCATRASTGAAGRRRRWPSSTRPGLAVRQHAARLRQTEPLVAEVFDEADRVMTPLLGRTLSSYLFVDPGDARAVAEAEEALKQTAITQPRCWPWTWP